MSLFTTGLQSLQAIEQEAIRRKESEDGRKYLKVWFKDGDSKVFRFLMPEPVIYFAHIFDKGRVQYVCTDHKYGCKICKAKHLQSRPSQLGKIAVRYVDAPDYNDQPQNNRIFIWDMTYPSLKNFAVTVSKLKKGNMTDAPYDVVRSGTGSTTSYQYFRQDPESMTEEEQQLLTELPNWEDIIKAPTAQELDDLISGNVPFPVAVEGKKAPAPTYDRRAEAAAPKRKAVEEDEETPPWNDEIPVRSASDFV
jgi:hypothetical protein